MTFESKTVIITGASSGIGKACAIEFARAGSNVVLASRNIGELLKTETECLKYIDNTLAVECDVSDEKDCNKLINQAISAFGRIDILINNAGMSMRALFEDVDISVLKKLHDVNFWGAVYCTKFALPELLKNKGSIVGISSIAGFKGLPGRTGYSSSKFALNGFLESLRVETQKKGLHVLICAPGYTASNIRNTALNSSGNQQKESPLDESKLMQPEEVARYIIQAIKKRKSYLILTSLGRLTVLLNKFFPLFMDKMVYNRIAKEPDSPFK